MHHRHLRLLTALSLSVAAFAQSSDTTGAFRGRVSNGKGAPVAGATVIVKSKDTGLTRTIQTTPEGTFSIGLLPVGNYNVMVKATGLKTVEDKVQVNLGDASARNYRLDEEATAVVEIVAASQSLDTAQVNSVATVDEKLVQSIPLVNRNFLDLVRLTPGAVAGPGAPPRLMVEGARQIMNNLQIDGATNNSNFFGEQRGGAIIPFVFGADTIRELQVITNGYDAQYGNAAGAVINAITKSGTNEFGGSALYLVRNDKWMAKAKPTPYETFAGNNSELSRTRVGDSYNFSFTAGGPIIKDKLFYFVGYETYGISRLATPGFGATTGAGNTATDFANFTASKLFNVFTSQSGHTLGQEGSGQFPYSQETKNTSYFGRLDYNLNDAHRLTLRLNYNKFKDTIGGGNSVTTPESNELLNTTNAVSWVLEHSAIWTPELVTETRLQVSNERRPFAGNGVSPAITLPGSFFAGTKTSTPRQMNEIMTELINNTTWTRGDWTFKAGFDFQTIGIDNQFFNNGNGAITFGSYAMAAAWANGTIAGTAPGPATPGTLTYTGAVSYNGGRVHIDTKLDSEYMQAQYQGFFDKRLTLTAGLRFNQQTLSNNPRPNANLGGLDSAVGSSTVDPRFAFALDLFGNGKTVLRGGHGWFSTPTPMLLVANTMTGNGNTITNYSYAINTANAANVAIFNTGGVLGQSALISGQTFNKASDATLQALATNPAFAAGGASAVQVWDPETKMSRAKKTSLGVEHDFGNGFSVSSKVTYTEFSHLQYLENINLNQVGNGLAYNDGYATNNNHFLRVGRPNTAVVHGHTLDFRGAALAPGNPAGGFGDVYLVKGDAIGRYKGLNVEVKKSWSQDLGVQGNVTFSKAMDQNSNERGTFTSSSGVNSELALAATTNPADPRSDYGHAWADRTMVLNVVGYFPIVFGVKGSARFNYSSGLPYSALSGRDENGDGIFNDLYNGHRNAERQPHTKTMDLRISRVFQIYGKYSIETSLDVFNAFNWANQFISDNQEVVTTSTGAPNTAYQAVGGRDFNTREVQLGVRVRF